MKITLQEIIDQVAEQTGVTKKLSEDFLREFLNIIEEALNKGDIVKIKGLGTFKLLPVEERKSVNVQTGEEITIPSHNKISCVPEKELKVAINKPYSHLETYILSKDGPVDQLSDNDNENENEDEDEENEIPVIIDEEKSQPEIVVPIQEEEVNSTITEEETNEEEINKTETTNKNDMKEKEQEIVKEEKKGGSKWIIIVLMILGLIALLLWLWHMDNSKPPVKEEAKIEIIPEDEIDEDEIDADQFSHTEYVFDNKFDPKLVNFMRANHPNMKLITYGTPKDVELKEGRRLTLMSRDYYGNKDFWVYIYLYNTDIIQNPNDIPAGTILKVPNLDKSLVDPNNQTTINVAREIQSDLLKIKFNL